MRKKVNWWWVVATHTRGTVSREECSALSMPDFLDLHTAARVFTSFNAANLWKRDLKRKNCIPEGIQLRVLSDEAWEFASSMYYKGKIHNRTTL